MKPIAADGLAVDIPSSFENRAFPILKSSTKIQN